MRDQEGGFTLVELLVVTLIIAILAALAIPLFKSQKDRALISQTHSVLKGASIAAESYAVNNGGYEALDGDTGALLESEGFQLAAWREKFTYVRTQANAREFCIEVRHRTLQSGTGWKHATYRSSVGRPSETNNCPNL